MADATTPAKTGALGEVTRYFLRLGFLGFGGPVALVGQMERELVSEQQLADEGADARGDRDLPDLCRARSRSRSAFTSPICARGFWGAWAGGWAFILPELRDRRGAWRALRLSRRPQAGDRHLLWRQPGGDRADPALLLPARQARHGGLAAMGDRRGLPRRHRGAAGRSRAAVHRRRHRSAFSITAISSKRPPVALEIAAVAGAGAARARAASSSSLGKLLLFFLKAGSLTFGSGLVIVPFLEQGLVQGLRLARSSGSS